MPKRKVQKLIQSGGVDVLVKMIVPKLTTAAINLFHFGIRTVIRSSIVLLRTNLFTRIISAATMLLFDVYSLIRKRISVVQFIRNCVLSLLMVLFGTIGWDIGSQWFIFEFLGFAAEIVGGIIGAGILSVSSNAILTRVCNKVVKSDTQKMYEIIDPLLEKYSYEEKLWIKERVTNTCIKAMHESENREEFAKELIESFWLSYQFERCDNDE